MALFSRKKKSSSGINTEDEILGFLDDLFQLRVNVTIQGKSGTFKSSIYFVDSKNKVARIQNDPEVDKFLDKPVKCGFSLDRTWYMFSSKVKNHNGKPHIEIPEEIVIKDRRKSPRSTVSRREGVKVSVLEGLGSGIGVSGWACDIGLKGIGVSIERAIVMQNQKEITPSPTLMKKGTKLALVKINRIPGVPVFESPGVVVRVAREGGWKLAIELSKVPSKIEALISKLLSTRSTKPKPIRRSRKRRQERDAERAKENKDGGGGDLWASESPASKTTAPAAAPVVEKKAAKADFFEENQPNTGAQTTAPPTPVGSPADFLDADSPPAPQSSEGAGLQKNTLISLGGLLDRHLVFLNDMSEFHWVHVDNPMRIVKNLNEKQPRFLLLPWIFRGNSMLDYLQKIQKMGVLKDVVIVLFSEEDVPMREVVKSKMLGVKHTLKFPLDTPDQVLDILRS
ncbi:MAG: hypothetical protein GY765_39790 [bacterium]|nr:hypothetical protein [bacterium]